MLNNVSFEYKVVSDFNELDASLNTQEYSLVLSSLNFVSEVIKLKHNKNLDFLSIVLLSPNSSEDLNLLELEEINDVLEIPISNEYLLNIIDKYLSFNDNKIKVSYSKKDAMSQLGLDELTVDMLLDNFFLTLDNDILNLEKAKESNDKEKLEQAAHYLKGSCLNLAMNDAAKILQDIEIKANNSNFKIDLDVLKKVFEEIKQILKL